MVSVVAKRAAGTPGVRRNLLVLLVVAACSEWLGVNSAHADFTLRCYDWRASAPHAARVYVSEGDSFVINVDWDGHSLLSKWAVEWNTQRGSTGTATSGTDYEPRDDYRQTKRNTGEMDHTFSTIEDDRYEGDETYEAGYSFASGSGGHDFDRHEYCPVTIEDDDDLKVDRAWINSTPADGHTYRTGEWIEVAAKFNGRAAVDGGMFLAFGFHSSRGSHSTGGFQSRIVNYRRGSGTDTLVFGYQVDVRALNVDYEVEPYYIQGDGRLYGVWTDGGHHREDTANRIMPDGYGEQLSVDGRRYVRSVSVTSRPRVGDTYRRGEEVEVQVTFDREVVVSGVPVVGLTVGGAWRGAGYTSGSGTRVLSFHYEVGEDHTDTDGISIRASDSTGSYGLVGTGSSIADDEFDVAANRAYRAQSNLSGHKVDGRPYVRSVSVTSRPRVGDTYGRGETVEVQVTFDREVVVSGLPEVALIVGSSLSVDSYRRALYASGSGTKVLTFHYEIGENHTDTDGITIRASDSALRRGLVGGSITDEFGSTANRAYSQQSMLSGHKVDGTVERAPSKPTGLTAAAATPTTVALSWTAPEHQGASAVTGYKVDWSPNGTDGWSLATADTGSDATSWTHTGRSSSTTYFYRVSAINSVGIGAVSDTASGTTQALPVVTISASVDTGGNPVTVVTEGEDAKFTLTFTGNVTELGEVAVGLEKQGDFFGKAETTSNMPLDGSNLPPSQPELLDASNLPPGQPELHVTTATTADALDEADGSVTAILIRGDGYTVGSPRTATVTVLDDDEVPGAIEDLAAAPGDERVVLSWSPPMDAGTSPVAGFDYRVSDDAGVNWSNWTDTGVDPGMNDPAHTVTNLDNGTPYTFEVQARSAAGNGPPSNRATGTPLPPPVLTSIEFTSEAGDDDTYAIGDDIVATVTFDRTLRLDTDNGTPALTLTIGNGTGEATCALATDTKKLECTYTVVGDDEDTDGVSIGANQLALGGGRIHGIHGATGGDAELTHAALGSDASHKVDGVRPTPANASVNGIALTLEWSEPLDTGSAPAAGQFALAVDSGTAPAVSSLTMSGTTMALTLASAADATRDYTLAYTVPSSNPVKDLAGNEAVAFTGAGIETVQITWSFTLTSPRTDGAGNALVVEGGATATATVSISNAVTTTVAQKVKLQWGGTDIGGDSEPGRMLAMAGVVGPTITVPAGDSSASAVIGVREDALYAPTRTAALTATHLGTQIGSAELTLTDDDAPPVMTIAVSASAAASDTRMDAITINEGGGFHLEITLDRGFATFQPPLGSAVTVTAPPGTFNAGDLAAMPPSFARDVKTFGTIVNSTDNTTAAGAVDAVFAIASDADGRYTVGTPMSATVRILDDDDVPTVPRNLTAKEGDREVALRWKLPRSYNDIELTGYQYRARGRGGAWRPDWTRVPDSEATTRSYTVTGLANDTAYTFEVRAVNDAGAGPQASVTATPRDHGLFVSATTIGEGGSATVTIIPQEAPFDTAETVTMVLASAQGPDQPRETSDFRVTTADDEPLAGTDRPFTVPGRTGRHPHPHYAVAFAPADSEAMVKVRAVDDDVSECREEILVYAYTDYGTAAEKRISTRPSTVAHSIFLEDDDRQATLESAAIDGATATLTFDRAVALVTEPGDADDPGYKPNPPHHYFTLFTGARPGENAVGTLATGFSLSGRTATVTFPEAVERGVTAWVRYDRFDRWAPLGKPTAGRCGQAVPTATWALGESSGGGTDNLPTLSIADGEGTEGTDATVDFTVTRTGTPTGVITVSYATRGGSALADNDFVSTSGSLAFGTGESTKTISVPIIDDTHEDDVETFTVTLSNPVNATIADGTATGTIHNTEDPREPSDALTASFSDVPATHDGSAFTFGLTFSEAPDVGYAVLRDDAFTVSGGSVKTAQRRAPPSNLEWNITVEPTGTGDVTVELSTTSDCAASDAICTADETPLTGVPAAFTVAGPTADEPPEPLTASFGSVPAEHDGTPFTFALTFSEAPEVSYVTLREDAFAVTGGTVERAQRKSPPSNLEWTITVEPLGHGDVSIGLSATTDCDAEGAICTDDDRPLSNANSATVRAMAALSVADAEATEGAGATLEFAVTLSRAASGTVTVGYATADGTAVAGSDYTSASGTLVFDPGETSKSVPVPVLDDSVDDEGETVALTLSNPSGARLADAEATGTINNSDPLPLAWLVRFGRTASDHAVEAIGARFEDAGGGSHATFGGRVLWSGGGAEPVGDAPAGLDPWGAAEGPDAFLMAGNGLGTGPPGVGNRRGFADNPLPGAGQYAAPAARVGLGMEIGTDTGMNAGLDAGVGRGPAHGPPGTGGYRPTPRDLLIGSSFLLSAGGEDGAGAPRRLTGWGRAAATRFDGVADGVSVDGEVATFLVGADAAWNRWLAGVSVAHSVGAGAFRGGADGSAGKLDSTLTAVHPYLRYRATDRLSAWGVLGYGAGDLTLATDGSTWRTDTSMRMAAGGMRGVFLRGGGLELAAKVDARLTHIGSEAATGETGLLGATSGGASRLRLLLEGARAFALSETRMLTPTLELGVRRDAGDAETGAGVDLGGSLRYADAALGVTVDASGRYLVAHEDDAYREWGASASIRIDPGTAGRGLTLAVAPSWGASATGGAERLWSLGDARGLAGGGYGMDGGMRLDAGIGYGMGAFRGRGGMLPFTGLRLAGPDRAWRAGVKWTLGANATFGFEATRRESPLAPPAHGIELRAALCW